MTLLTLPINFKNMNNEKEDNKDKTIRKLLSLIDSFKQYDRKRSKLLNSVQNELDYYSDMYLTVKDRITKDEVALALQEKVKALKTNLRALAKQNEAFRKQLELIGDSALLDASKEVLKNYDLVSLKERYDKLRKEYKRIHEEQGSLVIRLVQKNLEIKRLNEELKKHNILNPIQ